MGPIFWLFWLIPLTSVTFSVVGLSFANMLLARYLVEEPTSWGWVTFEIVIAALNCVAIGLNVYWWIARPLLDWRSWRA